MRRIPGLSLWLGHAGDVRDLQTVLSTGIQAIVDLAIDEPPQLMTRDVMYCRFPLHDGEGNPIWMVRAAVRTVADLIKQDVPTLVACSGGMSRSPTIAAAAIASTGRTSLEAAIRTVIGTGPQDVSAGLLAEVRRASLLTD